MGALSGIKVLDLSPFAPGRYATTLLADMGADVIGIEVPSTKRKAGAFKMLDDDTHPRWLWHQRNKRSLTLNLKSETGAQVFRKLVETADVVVEGFRPGAMKRLNADYEALVQVNPKIIYCSISGFGQDGPYAQLANHEPNYQALSGVMDRNRLADGQPHMSSAFLGDLVGGSMMAVVAILSALMYRGKTGEGQFLDISMTAGLLPLLGYHVFSHQIPPTPRLLSTTSPAFNIVPEQSVYRTKDDKYVAISLVEPHLWTRACKILNCEELIPNFLSDDETIRTRTFSTLEKIFEARTRDEWDRFNLENDIGLSPVKNLDEVLEDPQMRHRKMVVEYDYEPVGVVKHIGFPFLMSKTPANEIRNIPRYGENTDEILRDLGYTLDQIDGMRREGVC